MKVTVRHLVHQHRVCDATVTDDTGQLHRIGHTVAERWHCVQHGPRCPAITPVRDVVIDMATNS